MRVKSRAPLRLGLAGGGTDVSPYCDVYGGHILNATIDMYAYATIEPLDKPVVILQSLDMDTCDEYPLMSRISSNSLLAAVYNRFIEEYNDGVPIPMRISTRVDAPPGSGLGSSSTLVVALVGAFVELLHLPLGEYDIAKLAYEIERIDVGISGGKQDQYAATFGGFNFMEFYENKVIVNPLRVKREIINELESNLLLYWTGQSRYSGNIIQEQARNVSHPLALEAMHKLKEQATLMKEALLQGRINEIGDILDYGWNYKKRMADDITNAYIEEIYRTAKDMGATGGKLTGAGGGGYLMLFVPEQHRYDVMRTLRWYKGRFERYHFTKNGLETWRINND